MESNISQLILSGPLARFLGGVMGGGNSSVMLDARTQSATTYNGPARLNAGCHTEEEVSLALTAYMSHEF